MAILNHNELHKNVKHEVISKVHLYEQEDNKICLSMIPADGVIRHDYEYKVFRTLNQLKPRYGIDYTPVGNDTFQVVQLKVEGYKADTKNIDPYHYKICKDGVFWLNDPYLYIYLCISDFFEEDSEPTKVGN